MSKRGDVWGGSLKTYKPTTYALKKPSLLRKTNGKKGMRTHVCCDFNRLCVAADQKKRGAMN